MRIEMVQSRNALRWAANFVALSAGLHILAALISGFSSETMRLLPVVVVFAGFAFGLLQGWRWLAYIVFIVLLIEASFAISNFWANGDVPGWVYVGIAVANFASVVALFAELWMAPNESA
jgi:hypothetical protein